MILVKLLVLVVASLMIAQTSVAQEEIPDSLRGLPIDQDSIYTAIPPVDSTRTLPPFFESNRISLYSEQAASSLVNLSGNQKRIHYSLRDAVRQFTDFYGRTFGPMGQTFSLSYLGLPSYMIENLPDAPGSYELQQFPPTGSTDLRLFSLEQGDILRVTRSGSAGSMASLETHRSAFNDSTALADVSIFKGDYSFANTDVVFRQAAGERFAWGLNIGVEQSDGYLAYARKERENYNLDLRWKLNPHWQLTADSRLMNCDDEVSQLGRWTMLTAEREIALRQLHVEACNEDSAGNATRLTVSYGRFQEKIRSPYLFLRQQHENFSASAEMVRGIAPGRLTLISRLWRNMSTFDPGYVHYTRLRTDGSLCVRENSVLSFAVAGHYLFDYGDASRIGAAVASFVHASEHISANMNATIDHTPPSDMARFLKARDYIFDFDGVDEYEHSGDPSLKPTLAKTLTAAIVVHNDGDSLTVSARASRLDDLVIWERYDTPNGELYRSKAVNCNLHSLTASGVIRLPVGLLFSPSYTYSDLAEAGSDRNISLMPRHNIYAVLSSEHRISGLRLDVRPSIETEYHSANYRGYSNPIDLEGYFALHIRLSIRIKNFTYFYTMENVLNKTHETAYGYPSFRRVWWGIRWLFLN